jgi:hypothetical protein
VPDRTAIDGRSVDCDHEAAITTNDTLPLVPGATRARPRRLFVRHYDEVGVSIGGDRRAVATSSDLRAGVSFLFSPGAHGATVSLRGRF